MSKASFSKRCLPQETRARLLFSLGVCVLTFTMMCMFLYGSLFVSDEEEIFNKGQAIVCGNVMYSEIGSQHMPLMYYIAAVFALLGADTVVLFRLCFYLLFALLWGLIAYRYSPRFGRGVTVLTPIIFLALLPTMQHATTVLSEHAQAIGMVILGFELLQFRTDKPLTIGSCLMISTAIFLSFGSAFVSIFAVFAIGVTVATLEILACIKEKRGIWGSVTHLFKRYWKLVLIVAAPFAVMLAYFTAVGAMDDFIGWAYGLNRVIYPKYTGYGSSIITSMFAGVAKIFEPFNDFSFELTTMMYVGVLLAAAIGLGWIYHRTKNIVLTGGMIFFLVTAATRDCFRFHGVPAVAVLSLLVAIAVVRLVRYIRFSPSATYVKQSLCVFCAVLFLLPFLKTAINTIGAKPALHVSGEITPLSQAVDTLTEEGEGVGFSLINYEILISSHTVPATATGGSCPWLWEYASAQVMEELQQEAPRVFLFDHNQVVWDYKITDYAQDLMAFIDDNYRSLADYGYDRLYVHNDYYEQALVLLELA